MVDPLAHADSVAALQKLLAVTETDIQTQKEVLLALERWRSNIQRRLNALRDPIARIPVEISAEIFTHYAPNYGTEYASVAKPLLLLRICSRWTEIAVATPRLWANLDLQIPREVCPNFVFYLDRWLARSKNFPLSLSISDGLEDHFDILNVVTAHAHHIRELDMRLESYMALFSRQTTFPLLEVVDVKRGRRYRASQIWTTNALGDMWQYAPNLTSYKLQMGSIMPPSAPSMERTYMQETLTSLTIIEDAHSSSSHVLSHFTLPSLTSLDVQISGKDLPALISFVERSSPLLTVLCLTRYTLDDDLNYTPSTIERLFRLLPAISSLELRDLAKLQDTLISMLTCLPLTSFLPSLTEFTITRRTPEWPSESSYKPIADMLKRRSEKLRVFSFDCGNYRSPEQPMPLPHKEERAIFRKLSEGGMDIDLGVVMLEMYRWEPADDDL
ncbi:hypothetical protein R3P38DRAFT_3132792 [Favolaschia claudopus]|uniref:F-box domain-containing protein n=1 Tax=Favolaschia claudopus TaxID=2862362 RepID=A0AAV9Z8Y4_9AGAR